MDGLKSGGREGGGRRWQPNLFLQLYRFVRLRWVAGVVMAAVGVVDRWGLDWYHAGYQVAGLGAGVLAYNAVLWAVMWGGRERRWKRWELRGLAWVQLLLDLTCLTVLTVWTGGAGSPVLAFYVFHMVFASLLLPRMMAYGAALAAVGGVMGVLWATRMWPRDGNETGWAVAWGVTLLGTVHLANHIVRRMREHRGRLERQNKRVRAMARKLRAQQEMMIQQEKMAALGQLAAGVAHEVANPLASMDGLLQMMERKPEKVRPDAVARLREQVGRINEIVRGMMAFARPGEGGEVGGGGWERSDLNVVAGRALEIVRYDPRWKGVKLEVELGESMPTVAMQATAIEQVVVNLVLNALDAVEGVAEPRLTVRTAGEGSGGGCRLEVRDNGVGIKAEHIKRIFEPFFTTKPVGKGTGLGLSISYSLMRRHGGEILVESEPGKGTAFVVRLPGERGG